ncbi:Rv0361 family membrane protein [Nocardia sp. NBC_01327]|uniref:Rv0361 family membrane protein n=1 Tax=Nocardia sp. NBC_01327 TaxID=2903593 RepID=UPI002E15061D|nr:hypothetical protein OG326_00430 [Nocardia sp. NBC_01327]
MSDVDDQAVPIDQDEARSMLPFLLAAGILVLVVIGIVIATLMSPAEKNLTDSGQLAVAARNFIQSRSDGGALDPAVVCKGFDDNRSPLKTAVEGGPKLDIVGLADSKIDGDHATAAVTFRADSHDTTATWNFTRADTTWLVCNS